MNKKIIIVISIYSIINIYFLANITFHRYWYSELLVHNGGDIFMALVLSIFLNFATIIYYLYKCEKKHN